MDETVLFPSPNWFQVSGLAASSDNWLIYGGPSKSLCVLEPLPSDYKSIVSGNRGYKAHVLNRAHPDKVVSVDISPEWPEKRYILTGSADGSVKQWSFERVDKTLNIKSTHSHEVHSHEKEEVAGVGYSNEVYAVTVGCFGNIVKWDLNSNIVKTYAFLLKGFKPVCMACSQHIPLNVAVGTKQGVIFVLDLNGASKIVYKVRGQDDEIMNLSWCPQYEVTVKKSLDECKKKSTLSDRLEKIRNEPEPELSEKEILEVSGVIKKLPDDSFNESIVQEDDMFDIYKDHEADEFGHKKYQPEDILVKVKVNDEEKVDYLADCLRLKEEILKRKNLPEPSIQSLVEALDKTHVDEGQSESGSGTSKNAEVESTSDVLPLSSVHTHKHLLATIGKCGGVRIWSKSGKLVSSCVVANNLNVKNQRNKGSNWPTLLWYAPDVLLIADGKSQLVECNPLNIDRKNKLQWHMVHTLHKRGLYCIVTNVPRVQSSDTSKDKSEQLSANSSIWTISQERNLVEYCMKKRQKVAEYATCGGFIYMIDTCPYDAGKIAISVGDGAVRVWETSTLDDDDTKLSSGQVSTYWQNVQGKVLTVAWHPTKENLLAFGTAESRVGLIDTHGKMEKPAKVLTPGLSGAVYGLCWGENRDLYACGGGELVVYRTDRPDEGPLPIVVQVDGQRWDVCAVRCCPRALLCGSCAGAVAVLDPDQDTPYTYKVSAAAFLFTKLIHSIDWHPQQTSTSDKESPYKNLIAVSSVDKEDIIVILEYEEGLDGCKKLTTWKKLVGHKHTVFHVSWNPHKDGQLLSSSQDFSVRIWDVEQGVCTSIFGGHSASSMGACWSAFPQLSNCIVSGGGDCCLRLWDMTHHSSADYEERIEKLTRKDRRKIKRIKDAIKKEDEPAVHNEELLVAATLENYNKGSRKFLLQKSYKQMNVCNTNAPRQMLENYLQKISGDVKENSSDEVEHYDLDFLNIFGSINDVNKLLDEELQRHSTMSSESYIMLSIFRGHIDSMIQYASQNDLLCPFLVSITPCVSFKYWKDVTQLYLAQIDRLVAKGAEAKLYENRLYGGGVYRKAATLLSIHDIKGAVATLTEARLFKEAYVLCRTRYIDSIAEDTLYQWAQNCVQEGKYAMAATCYIALGNLSQAAAVLGKSNEQDSLSLAADIAKVVGQTTFADQVEKKAQLKGNQEVDKTEELLEQLPSKIELLLKDVDKVQNGETPIATNGD